MILPFCYKIVAKEDWVSVALCLLLTHWLFPVVAEEFHLDIDGGEFTDSEIIVMLGENGKIISKCSVCLLLRNLTGEKRQSCYELSGP